MSHVLRLVGCVHRGDAHSPLVCAQTSHCKGEGRPARTRHSERGRGICCHRASLQLRALVQGVSSPLTAGTSGTVIPSGGHLPPSLTALPPDWGLYPTCARVRESPGGPCLATIWFQGSVSWEEAGPGSGDLSLGSSSVCHPPAV